jgi:phospholipid/cholesterol/gamma-HCH transport system substrate-binding protein
METDRHYFIEGLFIIGFSIAAVFFFVWLQTTGHRDDVLYRIHFNESVSGLALGDPVKFHGVDVGTKASLKLKGFTGVVFIELNGGAPNARSLAAVTPEGQIPEIASEKSSLAAIFDQLPKVIEKFSAIEDQTKKVVTDVGEVTGKIKDNPLLRFGAPKEKAAPAAAETAAPPQKEKAPRGR